MFSNEDVPNAIFSPAQYTAYGRISYSLDSEEAVTLVSNPVKYSAKDREFKNILSVKQNIQIFLK